MSQDRNGPSRARRGRLLPTASGHGEFSFLDPLGQHEANSLRADAIRSWLTDTDIEQIRAVIGDDGEGPNGAQFAEIEMIVDRRIDAVWHNLSAAWGVELIEEDRAPIKSIVDEYLCLASFETSARPVAEARHILEEMKSGAESFKDSRGLLASGDNIDNAPRDAAHFVEGLIVERWRASHGREPRSSLTKLIFEIDGLLHACKQTGEDLDRLPKEAVLTEGDSWRWMIGALLDLAQSPGFPTSISKGRTKWRNDARASHFVDFVWRLQAAPYLNVTTGWLAKRRVYGDGPPYTKLLGRVLYDRIDLDALIEQNKRHSTSDATDPRVGT